MTLNNDDSTPHSGHRRAPFRPRGFPGAGERLVREGVITPEAYRRAFAAETASWDEILSMDEAALDRELGKAEAAAIDAASGQAAGAGGEAGPQRAAGFRVVESDDPPVGPAPYRDHYRLRLAGVQDGLFARPHEIEEELKNVRRLLMASDECFFPDVFAKLPGYVRAGRLLLLERIERGTATLEGCVAYEQLNLGCLSGDGNGPVLQRVNVIRLLAARDSEHRSRLALRLCLEAQLWGTVRALYDDDRLACIGTLGVILGGNRRAPTWASWLGDRVKLVSPKAKVAAGDRVLTAYRDMLDAGRESPTRHLPYWFVIANRLQLVDAARYHMIGIVPYEHREDEPGLRIDYDIDHPCARQIHRAAHDLHAGDADAWRRFGLTGRSDATIWGPPPTEQMRLAVTGRGEAGQHPARAGWAA